VMPSRTATLWVLLLLLVIAVPAAAQLDMYAATHPFALPTATTTRLVGMGGFSSCIPDAGFANPAFAGALTDESAVLRGSVTSFDGGLRLNSQQASFAMPLQSNRQGVQISFFHLGSNDAPFAGFGTPAQLSMCEDDISLHYGRRLTDHWLAGVAVSPLFHNSMGVIVPGAPDPLAHLKSKADWGCRIGTVYELGDRGWIGAVYDRYDESVTGSGAVFGATPVDATSHSEEIVVGVAYRVTDRVLAAVEWQQLSMHLGAVENAEAGVRVGCEARLGDSLALRVGSNQGGLSAGVGWNQDGWSVNYAYVQDWNENIFGATYGGSDTHSFEATYTW